MAVLIEAITVVIRREAIDSKYPGGLTAFKQQAPYLASRDTLVDDGELIGISFMTPADVRCFCEDMARVGFSPPEEPVDLVVVDQYAGPTVPCEWIEGRAIVFEEGGEVTAARLVGGKVTTLFVPEGWTYADSLTAHHEYVPLGDIGERIAIVRVEGALEVWRDKATGDERYIERPIVADAGYEMPKALA